MYSIPIFNTVMELLLHDWWLMPRIRARARAYPALPLSISALKRSTIHIISYSPYSFDLLHSFISEHIGHIAIFAHALSVTSMIVYYYVGRKLSRMPGC